MRNVLAAAGVLVLVGAGTEWAAGPATGGIPRKEPAGHFRAMSPQRDSDDCYGAGVAVPAGLSVGKRGAVLDTDRDRVRAELAARLGINFRVRSPSFVLQLRPEALPPMSQKPANDTVGGGDVDIELVGELSGDMDELCERFLKHAEVRVLSEEEYEGRVRAANYTASPYLAASASCHGSNVTVRVLPEQKGPQPRFRLGIVSDHALDGVNASIRAALQRKLKSLPPPPGPESYPRPGDFLQPGPFGLEEDWTAPQEPMPTDFEVIDDVQRNSGELEVRFSVGDQWEQGDGGRVLLAEELRRRILLRKREKRDARREKKTAQLTSQEEEEEEEGLSESSICFEDVLAAGETLESLTDDLVAERLMLGQGNAAAVASAEARPGAALQLSDSMIEAYAKQMDLKHLNPLENPMDMQGLSVTKENGLGLSQLARHHWQREADTDMAKRWFRQALLCSPADADVLVQYGLFLVDALGAYAEAQRVFRRAISAASSAPSPLGYALTGYAECTLWLQGYFRDDGVEAKARFADNGLQEVEELLNRALQPPSEAEVNTWTGRKRDGGAGMYDHYPRALTVLAQVRKDFYGCEEDAKELLVRAVGWAPSYHAAVAALGCLLSRSSSPADLARAELLLTSVLRAHVRRLKFWALHKGGSWRRDTSQAGLRIVTTRLWLAYARAVLLRGADANVGLARDLAMDTIMYSDDINALDDSACMVKRETEGCKGNHSMGDEPGNHQDAVHGTGSARARGAVLAEGARCCLAALLLYNGEATLGSGLCPDAPDRLDDRSNLASENCSCIGDDAASAGQGKAVMGSAQGFVPDLDFSGAGGLVLQQGSLSAESAKDADTPDVDAQQSNARMRRRRTSRGLREAETLLMGVFFHNDKQPTALALYGGVLWLQRKYSAAIRVLAQAGVKDWVEPQEILGKVDDEGPRGLGLETVLGLLDSTN